MPISKGKTIKTKGFAVGKAKVKGKGKIKVRNTGSAMTKQPTDLTGNAYRRLLFDPCNADLVEPPYIGMESGYMIRTRDVVVPFYTGTGLTGGENDYFIQWSPANISSSATANYGLFVGGGPVGTTFSNVAGQTGALGNLQSNFINSTTSPVNTYRVVACCLTWIPTGPTLTRQGVVSLLSLPSPFTNGLAATVNTIQVEQACPHVRTNGAERHEIIWLPGAKDQNFDAFLPSAAEAGYGTLVLGLSGVDSVASAGGTVNSPRGRLEITTVWQWTSRNAGGVVQNVQAPPRHNLNDVLSKVVSLGEKIYTGAVKAEKFLSPLF